MAERVVSVDFIADIVCPWCYVGWNAFAKTRRLRPHLGFDVRWRPYILNAEIPPEGVDRRSYFAARIAGDRERFAAARAQLVQAAADVGAPLNLDAARIMPNVIDAHRLILWAASQGLSGAAVDALFAAYFVDGRDIGEANELVRVGGEIGLDQSKLRGLLASDADRETVATSHNGAVKMGVTAVPMLIFDRKTASVGADKPETYASAVDQALN